MTVGARAGGGGQGAGRRHRATGGASSIRLVASRASGGSGRMAARGSGEPTRVGPAGELPGMLGARLRQSGQLQDPRGAFGQRHQQLPRHLKDLDV
ncbi:hypothetical protein [Streptomyces sp. CC53]|uniref:hypothetical protein n=1 Tax=Streptomyces sp. CC53 TaxID=1906740 RepID=UPI00115FC0B8|nr:hypothetical protein [Streptomyces sp. CC53]